MAVAFLIEWLLCTVAFAVHVQPPTTIDIIKCIVAGVLVAIAIALVPGLRLG